MSERGLYVDRGGDGEPTLLLLHGMGGSAALWGGVTELLEKHWPGSWIAPDLPGHGRSPKFPEYSYDTVAVAVAEAVTETLGADRPVAVLGHSLGGAIGLALAAGDYGVPVTGFVGVGIKVRWTEQELAGAKELGKRIVPGGPREDAVDRAIKVAGVAGLWTPDHPGVETLLEHIRDSWRPVFDLKALSVGAPDMAGGLAALAARGIPATLAAGEIDPMSPREHLAALVPEPVVLAGLGHSVHVQDPAALLPLIESLRG